MKEIDSTVWKRKFMCDFYKDFKNPCFTIVSPVDVTNLYKYVKMNHLSFYYSLIFLSIKVLNSIDEFHYKIKGDKVFYCDNLIPSFTDLKKGEDQFYICTIPINKDEDMHSFCTRAKMTSEEQKEFITSHEGFDEEELVYISCLPWFDFTTVVEEQDFKKDDSKPHLCWGKYYEENGRLILHYEIQANHRLVDGYHIGLFFNRLKEEIEKL